MAETIAVEFEMSPDELTQLYLSHAQRVRVIATGSVFVIMGVGLLAQGISGNKAVSVGVGVFALLFGGLALMGLTKMPTMAQNVTARLAGPTRIQLSDIGVEYSGTNAAERIEWSRLMRVNDRPAAWVLTTKAPVTTYYIPKSAVPLGQREQFVSQLMEWSGGAYKFRKR